MGAKELNNFVLILVMDTGVDVVHTIKKDVSYDLRVRHTF
jgi:hypothetical protein